MRNKYFISIIIFSSLVLLIIFNSCSKVLDKTDLSSFSGDAVYNDSLLARSYVDYVYDQNSPGWPAGDWLKCTEEQGGETIYFDATVLTGSVADFGVSVQDQTSFWYKLRAINQFIQQMPNSTLSETYKKSLIGQILFFRAYRYFELVKLYGGVPILLTPQDAIGDAAKQADFIPRNKSSECFAQMAKDLDSAIAYLPGKWTNSTDWGRITSGAAAALKGRILLYWASPQFNPADIKQRYQDAYDANKQAIQILSANGFGLNSSFQNMWFTEVGNPEAVWSVGFNTETSDQLKKNESWDNGTRPKYLGTAGGSNQPTRQIADAFPMKDGKDINDPSGKYQYDTLRFYKNRDPRFDATIAYNGCTWPINGDNNYRLWTYYVNGTTVEPNATGTGFYCRKAIDPKLTAGTAQYAGTDWIELRYAEVVLNLAESACGINNLDEAYQNVELIRKRAGIEAGDGSYGLKSGMTRAEMFDAILHERQIEFAFEGKRYWDLRRWKLFEPRLNGTQRTALQINLDTSLIKPDVLAATRNDLNIDSVYKYYKFQTKSLDTRDSIAWQPKYYFFAIPQQALDNNTKLEQTKGWDNGTFDPLL